MEGTVQIPPSRDRVWGDPADPGGILLTPGALLLPQNGNITELLLKEGFARCVDWSIAVYTRGADKLRAAERWAGDPADPSAPADPS